MQITVAGRAVVIRHQEHGRDRFEAVTFDLCACHQPYVIVRARTLETCAALARTARPCRRPGCRHLVARRSARSKPGGPRRVQRFCSRACGAYAAELSAGGDPRRRAEWGREGRAAAKVIHRERMIGDLIAGLVGMPILSPVAEASLRDTLWKAYQRGRNTQAAMGWRHRRKRAA